MRRILIVANPAAGRGQARRVALRSARRLAGAEVVLTGGPGEAAAAADRAVREGFSHVLACGGDGTVSECASRLAHTPIALGILPCGRGNDLAAALGIPADPVQALEAWSAGRERAIDLGLVNGRRFCTVAGVGFDGYVAERVRRGAWRLLGGLSYPVGAALHLLSWRSPLVTLRDGAGVIQDRFLLIAVSNTGRYGGGLWIAPDSSPDDGLLDCCLVRHLSRLRLLRLLPLTYRGRHVREAEVQTRRAARFRIEAERSLPIVADGEPAGATPAEFAVEPRALHVTVPARS